MQIQEIFLYLPIMEIFAVIIFLMFLTFFILRNSVGNLYNKTESLIIENSKELKERAEKLKNLDDGLKEQPKEVSDREMNHIMEEIKKVSRLWKSRRERLKMGLWGRIKEESGEGKEVLESEKVREEYEEDKLSKLKREKERVEELIKRTKIKYHKREIDEESFREIIKDYQKELMEITMRISELESKS